MRFASTTCYVISRTNALVRIVYATHVKIYRSADYRQNRTRTNLRRTKWLPDVVSCSRDKCHPIHPAN